MGVGDHQSVLQVSFVDDYDCKINAKVHLLTANDNWLNTQGLIYQLQIGIWSFSFGVIHSKIFSIIRMRREVSHATSPFPWLIHTFSPAAMEETNT